MAARALILFAHGARSASWAAPFERLRDSVQAQTPDVPVSLAFLELMSPSLPDEVERLVGAGCGEVAIIPVFLGQGGHVLRDLPRIVEDMQREHPDVRFHLAGAVGEDPTVLRAMTDYCLRAAFSS